MSGDLQGKTVVITGATSGIGEAGAVRLAGLGARLVVIGRDRARGEATLARLRTANPGAEHALHLADLSRLSEMKRVSGEIAAAEPRIDVLVNNAGAAVMKRKVTEDGIETTFALNHLAYFVLTQRLLERLKATPGARIVSTASAAHRNARLDLDQLKRTQWAGERYGVGQAYGRSKLCNILWTRALARRLEGSSLTSNCFHPGVVSTRIWDNAGWLSPVIRVALSPILIPPEKGADTLVWLASAPEVASQTGGYYEKRKAVTPSLLARDDALGEALWAETAQIAGAA